MTTMITAVPREHVANVWHSVSPWLDKAIDRAHGRFHNVDILTSLIDGTASLWLAIRTNPGSTDDEGSGDIIGSLVFVITVYPSGMKVGRIDYIAGKDRNDWFKQMWDAIVGYAKHNQCKVIEMVARPGTAEYVKGWGGKAIGTFMEYNLQEN
jgi:hypothetical protein